MSSLTKAAIRQSFIFGIAAVLTVGEGGGLAQAAQLFRQELSLFEGGEAEIGNVSFLSEATPLQGADRGERLLFDSLAIDADLELRNIAGGYANGGSAALEAVFAAEEIAISNLEAEIGLIGSGELPWLGAGWFFESDGSFGVNEDAVAIDDALSFEPVLDKDMVDLRTGELTESPETITEPATAWVVLAATASSLVWWCRRMG